MAISFQRKSKKKRNLNSPPRNSNGMMRASSLLLAIFIAFIIATLSSLLLLRVYYYKQIQLRFQAEQVRYDHLRSGIALALADSSGQDYTFEGTLFAATDPAVAVHCRNWGVYRVATVTVKDKGDTISRSLMIGALPEAQLGACLYLADHNKPLALSGNALLKGDVYLPKNGVTATYLDGKGFGYSSFFEGRKMQSEGSLHPLLDRDMIQGIAKLAEKDTLYTAAADTDSVQQHFTDTVRYLNFKGKFTASGYFRGQVIIRSGESIEIPAGAHLEQVIMIAPYIRIGDNFKGSLQAIATDSIVVGENSQLQYPSALVLVKQQNAISTPVTMRVEDDCRIDGVILTYSPDPNDQIKTFTRIGKNFLMNGIVFSDGFLEPDGTINGTVITDYTILRRQSAIYDNHLMDVTINRTSLSAYYLAPPIFKQQRKNKVIQWLE
jgi:cytoskeletal protein CcmA (bactofilin family)